MNDEVFKCPECGNEMREVEDYEEKKELIDGGCSCHINPPCGWCTTNVWDCEECGHVETEQC